MYDTVGFFSKLKGFYVNGDYYAKRVLEIIDTPNKEEFGKLTNSIIQGKIIITDLTFAYDDKKILDNINLELKPNSLNVLVGSSGSGKSTLFLVLSKLYEADNGKIFFDDILFVSTTNDKLFDAMCGINFHNMP